MHHRPKVDMRTDFAMRNAWQAKRFAHRDRALPTLPGATTVSTAKAIEARNTRIVEALLKQRSADDPEAPFEFYIVKS